MGAASTGLIGDLGIEALAMSGEWRPGVRQRQWLEHLSTAATPERLAAAEHAWLEAVLGGDQEAGGDSEVVGLWLAELRKLAGEVAAEPARRARSSTGSARIERVGAMVKTLATVAGAVLTGELLGEPP